MQARRFIVSVVLALGVGVAAAASQDVQTIQGELLHVDPELQVLAIEAADGSEVQFRYDEQTEVTGTEEGIAGLAESSGLLVTVHYTMDDMGPRAIRIDVHDES